MGYGGMHPYPRRFGGGKTALQAVHDSLNAQRGTAYDAGNPESIVWLENHAIARAIVFNGWETNRRLSFQSDPNRMTETLPRWEAIMRINVPTGAAESARRAVVAERLARFGVPVTHASMSIALAAKLGAAFVGIEYIAKNIANVHVPDVSYPWGTVADGSTWYSTVAHILIRTQKPVGWTEGDFYAAVAKVFPVMDPIASSWSTFDWYRAPETGTPINVSGGPSAAGFYLNDEHNLDNNVFDV